MITEVSLKKGIYCNIYNLVSQQISLLHNGRRCEEESVIDAIDLLVKLLQTRNKEYHNYYF